MDKWLMCVIALILGMLVFHMLKGVCGCKVVEGLTLPDCGYPDIACRNCRSHCYNAYSEAQAWAGGDVNTLDECLDNCPDPT